MASPPPYSPPPAPAQRRVQRLVFGEEAELYDQARPSYPTPLIDDVVALSGGHARALDAGCGTGKATVLLAARGLTGVGVEPDPAMAAVARRHLAGSPDWRVEVSGFEGWSPPAGDSRFDLLVSAQAWHWFRPDTRFRKAHELLRPGGWLALWWNTPAIVDSPLRQAIDAAYSRFALEITYRGMSGHSGRAISGHPGHEFEPMPRADEFDAPLERSYPWVHTYTAGAWVDLMRTSSDHRMLPEAQRERVLEAVGLAIEAHGGIYEHGYVCELWAARCR
jgi:SAM-dependent methyltransferase